MCVCGMGVVAEEGGDMDAEHYNEIYKNLRIATSNAWRVASSHFSQFCLRIAPKVCVGKMQTPATRKVCVGKMQIDGEDNPHADSQFCLRIAPKKLRR